MDSSYESNTTFDYSLSKKNFFKLVDVHFNTSLFKEKRNTVHKIKKIDKQQVDGLNFIETQAKYEFKNINGKSILTLTDKHNGCREVLPFDVIYDLLIKSHIEDDGHEINYYLRDFIEKKYIIPNICFDMIQEACNVCKEKSEKCCGASKTGYVTFINEMKLNKKAAYNSVLIYLDEYTEFMIIRPTLAYDEMDITTELFKIFMEFGPPETVYINLKKCEKTYKISKILHNLCPSCSIILHLSNVFQEEISLLVMEAISAWMKETKSSSWEIGCPIIQHSLNNRIRRVLPPNVSITAHNLFFNRSILDRAYTDIPSDMESDSDDELLIKQTNMVKDKEDPLAIDVKKNYIQDESDQRTPKNNIIEKQRSLAEINFEIDIDNNRKRIEKNTLKEKVLDEPTVYNTDKPTADKSHISIFEGAVERQNIKSNENKRDTDERATGLNEEVDDVLFEAACEELSKALNDISGITLDNIDFVDMTEGNTENLSTSPSGIEIDGYLDDDDDDIDIDFGAEI